MADTEVQQVLQRADTISYGTLAEMNHFQAERVRDFKQMMQQYISSQISFYRDVSHNLHH